MSPGSRVACFADAWRAARQTACPGAGPKNDEKDGGDQVAKGEPLPADFHLVGTWSGQAARGGTVALTLTKDERFTWKYTSGSETKSFKGDYVIAGGRILLEDLDVGGVVLKIIPEGADAFVLRAEGGSGVRFERVK